MAAASGATTGKRAILWFRNDLRLHDNVIVAEAARKVKAGEITEVVPLYCYDPRNFSATPCGHPKTGPAAAQFRLESVEALQQSLRIIGSDLLVCKSKPEDVIAELAKDSAVSVLAQQEVTHEEKQVDARVRRAVQGRLQLLWGLTLYHLDDLSFDVKETADVFTPFKNKVEGRSQVRQLLPTPQLGDLPLPGGGLPKVSSSFQPASVEDLNEVVPQGHPQLSSQHASQRTHRFKGGEKAALERLQHYLWDSDAVANYFNTRNGMTGSDDSTKFSPWLASGCLSPRQIYHAIKSYEGKRTANKSTYWVIFELTWRDYYKFFSMKHGSNIFMEYGTQGRDVRWRGDPSAFQRWKEGTTGMPLVDANMRELAQTGWMSNRGRQNVASYLALDLEEDWRQGADWFESALVDYDVCSNWGNWVAAAGMTGGRINAFNITKQSKDYDAEGDYIKKWIPELSSVPHSHIHEPWKLSQEAAQQAAVKIAGEGEGSYPRPIDGTRYTGQASYQQGSHGRGGGRGSHSSRPGRSGSGRGGGRGRHGNDNKSRRKSDFEAYG